MPTKLRTVKQRVQSVRIIVNIFLIIIIITTILAIVMMISSAGQNHHNSQIQHHHYDHHHQDHDAHGHHHCHFQHNLDSDHFQVSMGPHHTCCLTDSGQILTFGLNTCGQVYRTILIFIIIMIMTIFYEHLWTGIDIDFHQNISTHLDSYMY